MPRTIEVKADVTGSVWQIEIAIGSTVAADDCIMLIESMKMEIPVLAPAAGVLAEVRHAKGDAVAEGDVVAIIHG